MATKTYSLTFDGYWRTQNISGLPAASGIYTVYAGTYNPRENTVALRKLIYVGESDNIRDRVANHDRWSDWKRSLQPGEEVIFAAGLIGPTADRQRAEAAVIYEHKPPLNTEYVDSFPFEQTTIMTSGKNAGLREYFTVMPTPAYPAGSWWR